MAALPLPRLSIITPSFNQAQFLEATLRSVLDQHYPNLEYLVIDGGSTDDSVAIIQRYADRLAYWVSEKDRGQSDAINKGLARATGEIVAWLNSDDTYLPGALAAQAGYLCAHTDVEVVYGDCVYTDAD
ncbi:MAG: glycosyltransferase family 2 protein, partial [Anaerolineales bacterium]